MLSQIISWPQKLTEFEFYLQSKMEFIDLPMIQSWLQIHQYTLKYIRIGYLPFKKTGPLFDASRFPNLEQLHLSRWHMSCDLDTAKADVDLLLGPKLRKFLWDFDSTGPHPRQRCSSFSDKEEQWVRFLAQTAIARDHGLEEIWIEFTPADKGEEGGIYPWDRMDRLQTEVRFSDLKVKYNEPSLSKDEWIEEMERLRKMRIRRERKWNKSLVG